MWTDEDYLLNFKAREIEEGISVGAQIRALMDERDTFGIAAEELKASLDHMIKALENLNKKYEKILQERNVLEDMNESLKAEIRRLKSQRS